MISRKNSPVGPKDDPFRNAIRRRKPQERLSMLPAVRISTAALMGAGTGLILGLSHGAKTIALRYRAENAHRLPTTHKGWYLYHKSKNYNCMLGGLKEGGEMAVKIGFWTMAFFTVENSMDKLRNDQKDVFNTMVAGVSTAGAFSVWNRFPIATASRLSRMGVLFGCFYGLTQDGLALLKGQRVWYVDYIMGKSKQDRPPQAVLG